MTRTVKQSVKLARVLTICACILSVAHVSAAQSSIGQIVVFGDSLSDTGNAFALLGTSSTPPDYGLSPLLVPRAPYARGGHHLSNGATWVEQLARPLGLAGTVRPALVGSSAYATNYAVATGRARSGVSNFDLTWQVNAFLQQTAGHAPADALYVIAIGGNDLRDALSAFPLGSNAIVQAALSSIAANISILHAAGARNFLVWLAPNIGLTPSVRLLDAINPGAALVATSLTQAFNAGLAASLTQLAALPGINIIPFDAFALITSIVTNPLAYGLTNATAACVTPNDPPFTCQQPDDFLFWDGIHPTTAGHAIIAREIAALLGL